MSQESRRSVTMTPHQIQYNHDGQASLASSSQYHPIQMDRYARHHNIPSPVPSTISSTDSNLATSSQFQLMQQQLDKLQKEKETEARERTAIRQQLNKLSSFCDTMNNLKKENLQLQEKLQQQQAVKLTPINQQAETKPASQPDLPQQLSKMKAEPIPIYDPSHVSYTPISTNAHINTNVTSNVVEDTSTKVTASFLELLELHKQVLLKSKSTHTTSQQQQTKFPKFAGKSKEEFRLWYDQILAVLTYPTWRNVYKDVSTRSLKTDDEIDPDLSAELFTALRTSVTGNAEKLMITKKSTLGKGLTFLSILHDTYKVDLQRADLLQKEREYLSMYQKNSETIDDFAARCITLREQLRAHGVHTTDDGLKDRFIMGLGPLFTEIQQCQPEDLPVRWRSTDIQKLIHAANGHKDDRLAIRERNKMFHEMQKGKSTKNESKPPAAATDDKKKPEAKPKANPPVTPSENPSHVERNTKRQARIEAAIKNLTFDPMDFAWEVRKNHCVWHDASHSIKTCVNINNLLRQYPNQQCYMVPKSVFSMQPGAQGGTPQQSQNGAPINSNAPSARRTTTRPPSEGNPSDMNPYAILGELQTAEEALQSDNNNSSSNSTNENVNSYSFTCRSVSLSNTKYFPSNEPTRLRFIVDSGASPHMVNKKTIFTTLKPWVDKETTHVVLADGKPSAKIEGVGTIDIEIDGHKVHLEDVLFIPTLSDSLYSAKNHAQTIGHYLLLQKCQATIAFPKFVTTVPITDEIYLDVVKSVKSTANQTKPTAKRKDESPDKLNFSKLDHGAKTPLRSTEGSAGIDLFSLKSVSIPPHSRLNIRTGIAMQFPKGIYGRIAARSSLTMSNNIDVGAGVIDNDYRGDIQPCLINNSADTFTINRHDKIAQIILEKYSDIELTQLANLAETKRGTGGFGSTNIKPETKSTPLSNRTWNHINQNKQKITIKLPWQSHFQKGILEKVQQGFQFTPIENQHNMSTIIPTKTIKDLSTTSNLMIGHKHLISQPPDPYSDQLPPPSLRVVDKPISTSTSKSTYSIDQLRKAFGFRNVASIVKELKETCTNFSISTTDREPILDLGEVSNMDKPPRNTFPKPLPHQLGDIVHMDIIFGSGKAIGGAKYALFLVDRATRHKFIYPLQNLTEDILSSLKLFTKEIGRQPKLIRTDFDHKLIGQKTLALFADQRTTIESAPPDQQNENGLCERNWRSILRMSRSWLASALLPSEFWWYAMKRATEVSNYLPIKINNSLTTPHELVYKQKADLRNLLPMFCVAYPKYKTNANTDIQSCKAILIGRSDKTHTYQFYHPSTKKIIIIIKHFLF